MAASVIYCGKCGTQNARSESFCASCGYSLATSSAAATVLPDLISTPTGQLPTHTVLKQRYQVLQAIGRGGMGAVYLAQDIQLGDRPVAVKEMSQSHLYGQQALNARENFKREAHLLAGLQHPNLPSIHDYFEEGGRWYLVISFIQGETLADYLEHVPDRRLSPGETLNIAQTLCDVLHYLHTHQPPIIFRDLKPSNIMRGADGRLYLVDFGIARHFKPGQTKDTATYGSMGYAPPEQYGRAQTTERSDIYSLGATLYQCLSGYTPSHSPFRLPPLQSLVPTLPDRLVRLIAQMLELDENQRPPSIKAVEQELLRIAAGSQYAPPPPPYAPSPSPIAPPPPPYMLSPSPIAPPPPTQYPQGQQVLLPSQQASNSAASSPNRGTFVLIRKVLSVIGMIIGLSFAVIGILGSFIADQGVFADLWVGDFIFFFGLMIFFFARMRRSPFPVPNARKIEATVGKLAGIIAIVLGGIIIVIGVITNTASNDNSGGVVGGVFSIIEGFVIWLVTRIRIRKTP